MSIMMDNFVTLGAYISTAFMWLDEPELVNTVLPEGTMDSEYLPAWVKILITLILVAAHVAGKLGWQPLKRREKTQENKDRLEGLDYDRNDDHEVPDGNS